MQFLLRKWSSNPSQPPPPPCMPRHRYHSGVWGWIQMILILLKTLGCDLIPVCLYVVVLTGGSHNCSVNRNGMLQVGKQYFWDEAPFRPSLLPQWIWWLSHVLQHLFFAKGIAEWLHSTRLLRKCLSKWHFTCFNVPKSYYRGDFCFREHSILF